MSYLASKSKVENKDQFEENFKGINWSKKTNAVEVEENVKTEMFGKATRYKFKKTDRISDDGVFNIGSSGGKTGLENHLENFKLK